MTNKVIQTLKENGPLPHRELPYNPSGENTRRQTRKLKASPSCSGSSKTSAGRVQPIYYLESHDKTAVLRTWLDENPGLTTGTTPHAVRNILPTKWGEAFSEVWPEYWDEYGMEPFNGDPTGGECPMCGTEFESNLPDHLPCEND